MKHRFIALLAALFVVAFACSDTAPTPAVQGPRLGASPVVYPPATNVARASFVYRQGAANPAPPIYGTFAAAYAAAKAAGGAAKIVLDVSLGTCVITAGAYSLGGIISLVGVNHQGFVDVCNVADGVTFTGLAFVGEQITLNSKATTAPIITDALLNLIIDDFSVLQNDATATQPFISVPASADVGIFLWNGGALFQGGTPRVLTAGSGSVVSIYVGQAAWLDPNSVTGAGSIHAFPMAGYTVLGTQAGAGAFVKDLLLLNTLDYTPSTSANWTTQPTKIHTALDQIAAQAKTFSLDVTLTAGTKTIASGKDLTNATLLSVRLKTATTAVGSPEATFVAGPNGNVTVASITAAGATATTDASTYTVTFSGAI